MSIILLQDLLDSRKRKQNELEFYNKKLEELSLRRHFIQKEIELTNAIIDMIEKEKMIDVKVFINDGSS